MFNLRKENGIVYKVNFVENRKLSTNWKVKFSENIINININFKIISEIKKYPWLISSQKLKYRINKAVGNGFKLTNEEAELIANKAMELNFEKWTPSFAPTKSELFLKIEKLLTNLMPNLKIAKSRQSESRYIYCDECGFQFIKISDHDKPIVGNFKKSDYNNYDILENKISAYATAKYILILKNNFSVKKAVDIALDLIINQNCYCN